MKKLLLFLFMTSLGFSQSLYKGNVSDKGVAIPGATICVLNTNRCATSDFDGNYSIEVKEGDQLQISYLGMKTKIIKISGSFYLDNDKSGVQPIINSDYVSQLQKTTDSVKVSKPSGYFESGFVNDLQYMEIMKISRKENGFYQLKNRYQYNKVSFEINQEYVVSAPIRLPKYQNLYAQGRGINGNLTYQSPQTNEIFSWGPNVNTLQYSQNVSEYYPQGDIQNRTSSSGSELQLYNPNHFFRNTDDSKVLFTAQIESPKGNYLKVNFGYKTGNISIANAKNNESTTSLKYFRKFSQDSNIETILTYNDFENNFSNANFGINKVVFANAVTPVHFNNKSGFVLTDGSQRSYSGLENNPYYLTHYNLDKNKSKTISFNFNHKYSKNYTYNVASTSFQSSEVKNQNGQNYYAAGITEPNFNKRIEKFKSFSASDLFKYTFEYNKIIESKVDFRYQRRDLERNYFSGFTSFSDFPNNGSSQNKLDVSQERFEVFFNVNGSYILKDVFSYYSEIILKASSDLNYSSTVKSGLLPGYLVSVEFKGLLDEDLSFTASNRYTEVEPSLQNNNLNFNSLLYKVSQFKQLQNNLELFTPKNAIATNENNTNLDLSYRIDSNWSLNFNYYFKKVKNLYTPIFNLNTVNWSPNVNYKQNGVEFTLERFGYSRRYFKYDFNLNFSYYKNEVTGLSDNQTRIPFAGFADVNKNYLVGQPLGAIVGSSYLRDAAGNKIIDADGFPIKDSQPKVLGNPNPDFVVGFFNSFQYKDFALNLSFDWSQGGKLWNGTQQTLDYYGKSAVTGEQRNIVNYVFEGVTEAGGKNTKAVSFYDPNLPVDRNRWTRYGIDGVAEDAIENATYFRLNSINLSYKRGFERNNQKLDFLISFFVNNVFVVAKSKTAFANNAMFNSIDSSGLEYFNSPMMRSFGSSLTIKF